MEVFHKPQHVGIAAACLQLPAVLILRIGNYGQVAIRRNDKPTIRLRLRSEWKPGPCFPTDISAVQQHVFILWLETSMSLAGKTPPELNEQKFNKN